MDMDFGSNFMNTCMSNTGFYVEDIVETSEPFENFFFDLSNSRPLMPKVLASVESRL